MGAGVKIWNHTGAITANEYWDATRIHHITGHVTITGGSSGNPNIVTIDPGAIIYFDGDYYCFFTPTVNDYGSVVMVGTEADKILVDSDPTNFPNAERGDYYGFFMGYNTLFDMDWVRVRHSDVFLWLRNTGNNNTNNGATINNCCAEYCEDVFGIAGGGAVDMTVDNLLVIDGLLCLKIGHNFFDSNAVAVDFRGSNPWSNIAILGIGGEVNTSHALFHYNINAKIVIDIDNFLVGQVPHFWSTASNIAVGEYYNITLTGFFPDGGMRTYGVNNDAIFFIDNAARRGTLTIEEGVFYKYCGHGIDIRYYDQANDAVVIQYVDILETPWIGLIYDTATLGALTMDHIHSAYGNSQHIVGSGSAAQPAHRQWYDTNNSQSPTNVETTNIFQLDVESVRCDHVGDATAVITYSAKENPSHPDSLSSPARKRLMGVPFVKYGKKSGELSSIAGKVPWDKEQRYEVFAKWRTDLGAFDTTNHQITIDALEGSTTYFFKPCFLDPLGRVAEWKNEGTFTTTSQGGTGDVSQAVYDSTYADLQRIKLEYDSTYNDLIRVRTAYDSTYNDLIRVRTAYDSTYNDLRRVSAEYDSTYNDLQRVRIDLADASRSLYIYMERYDSTYNDLIRVRTAYDSTYNDLQRIKISLDNTRRDLYRVTSQRDSTYNDLRRIQVEMDNTRRDLYTVRGQLDSTRRDLYRLRARQGTAQFRRELGSSGFFR